jgi:hypothetical protein
VVLLKGDGTMGDEMTTLNDARGSAQDRERIAVLRDSLLDWDVLTDDLHAEVSDLLVQLGDAYAARALVARELRDLLGHVA